MPKRPTAGPAVPLVVVAEDIDAIRMLLDRALDLNGFAAVTVADGGHALDRIRTLRPAAAILDWQMPGLDGTEVCRAVRADPEIATTPLILLTGFDVEIRDDGGADAVLSKPFSLAELVQLLRTLVVR